MAKGYSLATDLRLLINNPNYSDITIVCEDGSFYACKAILAARCEVFNGFIYNGMKETYENQIRFPEIKSIAMKIILNYIYTGFCTAEELKNDTIIDIYHAADYFQLKNLSDYIIRVIGFFLKPSAESNVPELLSRALVKLSPSEENSLLQILAEYVSSMPLNTIEYNQLSFPALKFLLSYVRGKGKSLPATEYEVFRFVIIHVAHQISKDAVEMLENYLPTMDKIDQIQDSNIIVQNTEFHLFRPQLTEILTPLLEFIDIRRIDGKILTDVLEPLDIITPEKIVDAYRFYARNHLSLPSSFTTETPVSFKQNNLSPVTANQNNFFPTSETLTPDNLRSPIVNAPPLISKLNFIWDESACGSDLVIEKTGSTVRALSSCKSTENVKGKILINDKGIYEWNLIVDKGCKKMYIGICAGKSFDVESFAGYQRNGWVFASSGLYWNDSKFKRGEATYAEGDKITVHLNMNEKTLAFSINDKRYPEISTWRKLPSKIYPVVSLSYPGQIRIQPH